MSVRQRFETWLGDGVRRDKHRYIVTLDDFGEAEVSAVAGDVDGSGQAPGVNIELRHPFLPGGVASVAASGAEAELVARAILTAAMEIRPHERLKVVKAKWEREVVRRDPTQSVQPSPPPPESTIAHLTFEETEAILRTIDPELADLRDRLQPPF